MVTGDIIRGSTSIGILIIAYSLTNDSNVNYHFIRHTDVQQPRMYPVVMGPPAGEYKVVIFVMEEDDTPFHRAAATPRTAQNYECRSTCVCTSNYLGIFEVFCITQKQVKSNLHRLLRTSSMMIPLRPVFASPVPSWTVLRLTVWQWYINESLSSALVD